LTHQQFIEQEGQGSMETSTLLNPQYPNITNHPSRTNFNQVFFEKKPQPVISSSLVLFYSNKVELQVCAKAVRTITCSLPTRYHQISWGTNTMSDTYLTSHKVTSRSLINSIVKEGIHETNTNKRLAALLAFFVCAFLLLGWLSAAEPENTGKTVPADVLRQDILRFVGPTAGSIALTTNDSYLIQLNRRTADSAKYGILVRGVDPVERALLLDAQDGKWDNFDLFRGALVAEGNRDPKKIREYEARLDQIVAKATARFSPSDSPESLTQELFEVMHREMITSSYDINCTALSQVLETGHFNCVSATVLFNSLAYKAGLDVYALEMPGHALSRVKFKDGTSLDIETTCPVWFELQDATARKNATMQRVAIATPAEAYPATGNLPATITTADSVAELNDLSKKLREISPVQLIATIYYNQGVDFHAAKRYAEAAMANIKALHLDPVSETAWGNFMAAINNWAIELTTEMSPKRYDMAALLLDQGVYLDPGYDKFQANQLHVYYFWIRDLAVEERKEDAQTVFALADQRLPGNKDLANLMKAVSGNKR
jgi:tetratricopeptide (TPR) repeat protein